MNPSYSPLVPVPFEPGGLISFSVFSAKLLIEQVDKHIRYAYTVLIPSARTKRYAAPSLKEDDIPNRYVDLACSVFSLFFEISVQDEVLIRLSISIFNATWHETICRRRAPE